MVEHPTYTLIATCDECNGKEIYRLKSVPLMEREAVLHMIPEKAVCDVADHNTFVDDRVPMRANYGATLTWYREVYNRKGKLVKLVREESPLPGSVFDLFPSKPH